MKKRIIIIGGATASGKSEFANNMAKKFRSVIVNADSQQVYREIPIITSQPSQREQNDIPHRLYGFLPAKERCNVGIWFDAAKKEINKAFNEDVTPIVVGGTGMYIKCLMEGVAIIPEISDVVRKETIKLFNDLGNEKFHEMLEKRDSVMGKKLNAGDSQRIMRAWEVIDETGVSINEWQNKPHDVPYASELFEKHFINLPREELYDRCNMRFEKMMKNGAIDEVKSLLKLNISMDMPAMKALGVPEIASYIRNEMTLECAIKSAQKATRNYAKRQTTWFRNQF